MIMSVIRLEYYGSRPVFKLALKSDVNFMATVLHGYSSRKAPLKKVLYFRVTTYCRMELDQWER